MDLAEDFDIPSIDGISEEEQSSLGVPESEITPDEKAPSSLPDEAAEAEVNLDDLSGFGDISGDEEPQAAEQAPEAAPQAGAEEPAAPGNDEADPFDSFNLAGADAAMPSLDSFDIPGVDAQKPAAQEAVVEEFKISEANLEKLLATLETYPLNVRIACEEIIAEQVIPPEQLNALTKLLISKGTAHEAARLASKILKYRVAVPKGYKTGEELEEEQATFSYIFIHKFFPIIRLCFVIMLMAACVSFLIYQFVYKPIAADILYRKGYELIQEGDPNEYQRANQHFRDAFSIHRVKEWFYKYAELYRDEKQFRYAREKYDELLFYYPHDKKGALDYAALEANWLHNYEKADRIVRTEILDYKIDDHDGLIALGDINLDWAEIEPSRYEEARAAYARVLELYGWTDDVLERMLLYFIRTDKLFEVLPLKQRFMTSKRSKISAMTLAELGGYLLDKRLEPPEGVPDENIERIEGIKDILIRAEAADPSLPEPHYHLARYYNFYGNPDEERWTLEAAARAFDGAKRETPKRVSFRIDNQRRLAASMTEALEFIPAENELVKGINIYEDAVTRGLVQRGPQFGRLYADMGDLEYFAKDGALENAARYYLQSEANGYMPPEIEYRLANTYYHGGDYEQALNRFFNVSRVIPFNRRLLYSMGNTALENKDYFAAEAYYRRLLDRLNSEIARLPGVLPDDSVEHRELIERRLWTQNNLAVTLHELSLRSGRSDYKQRSLALFAEAIRSNDVLERDQATLIRPGLRDPQLPGTNLPYLNLQHVLYPTPNAAPQIYPAIDSDVIEPSRWELRMQRAVNALVKRN
jgi:tetratricopeptide (TPR) repeat protein